MLSKEVFTSENVVAYQVGDLITIDVAESSSLAASQNSVRNRQSQVENAVQQFLFR